MSITIAATFFNEANAMPGFLEMASQFADEILLVDCGPKSTPSSDGTLDIVRKWGIDPLRWEIDPGYGVVRTQLLHTCKTPWALLLDIDERVAVTAPILRCHGTESYPNVPHPKLTVTVQEPSYNHRDFIISKMREADERGYTGVRFSRRHWFTASYKNPTQNWETNRDWQLRCLRTHKHIGFKAETRMHEHCFDWHRNCGPQYIEDDPLRGGFLDHLHCWFKSMEPEQRAHDIRIYDAIHGKLPPPVE